MYEKVAHATQKPADWRVHKEGPRACGEADRGIGAGGLMGIYNEHIRELLAALRRAEADRDYWFARAMAAEGDK